MKQARDLSEAGCPRVLERFQHAVGLGRIGGPYWQSANRRVTYLWYAFGAMAIEVISRLWPYLGDVKRRQAMLVRSAADGQVSA